MKTFEEWFESLREDKKRILEPYKTDLHRAYVGGRLAADKEWKKEIATIFKQISLISDKLKDLTSI